MLENPKFSSARNIAYVKSHQSRNKKRLGAGEEGKEQKAGDVSYIVGYEMGGGRGR